MSDATWGRVEADGTVYARDAAGTEKLVGQYPDGTPEEALAFFQRKFDDTNVALSLLERRASTNASAAQLNKSLTAIAEQVSEAAGVGDYAALATRIDSLRKLLAERSESEKEANAEAVEASRQQRIALVESVEALAAKDPAQQNWKAASEAVSVAFAQWQEIQKKGPRLPKAEADDLWKRFSKARTKLDNGRRAHFSARDAEQKGAKAGKEALVAEAEALAPQGAEGIPAYRSLLEQWKKSGRAGKKVDDALWAKFKAAGDVLYGAKAEATAIEESELSGNVDVKRAILSEAQNISNISDLSQARSELSRLQKKWDAAGKVPKANLRELEDGMRKIEQTLKSREDAAWTDSNPDKAARPEGLAGQIQSRITELEQELAAATTAKDSKKISELESAITTQKSWLGVL